METQNMSTLVYYSPARGQFKFDNKYYYIKIWNVSSRPDAPYIFQGPLGELDTSSFRLGKFAYHGNHWVCQGYAQQALQSDWWLVITTYKHPNGELRARLSMEADSQ